MSCYRTCMTSIITQRSKATNGDNNANSSVVARKSTKNVGLLSFGNDKDSSDSDNDNDTAAAPVVKISMKSSIEAPYPHTPLLFDLRKLWESVTSASMFYLFLVLSRHNDSNLPWLYLCIIVFLLSSSHSLELV